MFGPSLVMNNLENTGEVHFCGGSEGYALNVTIAFNVFSGLIILLFLFLNGLSSLTNFTKQLFVIANPQSIVISLYLCVFFQT